MCVVDCVVMMGCGIVSVSGGVSGDSGFVLGNPGGVDFGRDVVGAQAAEC
jgi:hypothetical protein